MSDYGYGWWQAADERWYPPEQHPSYNPDDPNSYGWWRAADGNSYPPNRHPEYRAAPTTPVAPMAAATMPPPTSPPGPPPPGAPAAPAGMAGLGLTPTVIGVLVAAVLIAIGSVLPWATLDLGFVKESAAGLDKDGGITLVLGLIVGALAFVSKGHKTGFAIGAVVAAALITLIAVIDIADINSSGVSVGIGLWLVLVASLGALGAGTKLIIDCRR